MRVTSERIAIICSVCASREVSRDAWAEWDSAAQDWVIRAVFDHGYCHDCDRERTLAEVLLADEPETILLSPT